MCECEGEQIRCDQFIPRQVPNNVSEVLLSFNSTMLVPGIFCNVSWNNVIKLSINYNVPWPGYFYLDDYVFLCLKQIQILKLHTMNYFNTTKKTLYGLESVTVLDLSGCERLITSELVILLSVKTSIANLKKLILSSFGRRLDGINFSQDLIDALADRDIKEIDLTNTTVSSNLSNMSDICDTLKVLNLSNSDIRLSNHLLKYSSCKSFRILDLNGASFPLSKYIKPICANCHGTLNNYTLFESLNILYFSRMISADKIVSITNCSVTGLGERYHLREIHLNGYNVHTLDGEIVNLFDQLQYFDLSGNRMQSIGPNIFKTFKHLMKLDLSKNKLSQSRLFDETFSVLFQNNSNLKEVSLNDNGLKYLPPATFSSNLHLKQMDISNNKIQQITFDVSRLISLDFIDMRNNSVQYLDKFSRGALDSLYEMQRLRNQTKTNSSTFLVDLRENPFSCKCDSMPFIKWFTVSPIFNTTRHQYHCTLDDREIEMNDKAVAAAKDDCDRPKRKLRNILLSSIIPTTVTATLILVTVYVVKRYRKKKKYQRLEDQVGLLHDDKIGFRFPVFVSYSSDDVAFVMPNVINPLSVRY